MKLVSHSTPRLFGLAKAIPLLVISHAMALVSCGRIGYESFDARQGTSSASNSDINCAGDTASEEDDAGTATEADTGDDSIPRNGCQMVDFLFVIDNSVSMQDQQAALIASFPGFISTIQATLSAKSDYHVMVVDTDATGRCTAQTCKDLSSPCRKNDANFDEYICNHIKEFTPCDKSWGAGVIHPAGSSASNQLCEIMGGNRYILGDDPKKEAAFSCVAQVGLSGHQDERPMDAMVAAVSDKRNGAGGCNEGFIREDAILVVTFITDDPKTADLAPDPDWDKELGPSDSVADWYSALLKAKNDNADAIVVLGLIPVGKNSAGEDCSKDGSGEHWVKFIDRFGDRGLQGAVCEEQYVSFFEQAVAVIDDTCDDFAPIK